MIPVLEAIFLGIIEGITEFLPISSTGHLIVAEELVGFRDAAQLFTVVVQLGAIAAVIWYFRKDLSTKLAGLVKRDKNTIRFWILMIVATLPAALVGYVLSDPIESRSTVGVVAGALIIGGFVLLWAEHRFELQTVQATRKLEAITIKQAIITGFVQMVALIPGVSRSGATIVGGMFAGLDRVTAAAFSFYLSIPIIVGAGLYKLISDGEQIRYVQGGGWALLAGTLAAFISALLVVSWLIKYISKHNFKPFAYYRIAFGCLLILLLMLGWL